MIASSPGSSSASKVIDALLGAAGHQHLVGLVLDLVVAAELLADGLAQLEDALDGRVLGAPGADGLDRRGLDVLRRIEIRLAGAEADDVAAGALEFLGLGGHGQGRRRLDAGDPLGEAKVHAIPPGA
jgi:hypothetical protein